MTRCRHFATTAIALGLSSGLAAVTAFAADLGAPAPAPIYTKAPLAVPFSWTGFYIGGNVGYGWGTADNDPSFSQSDFGGSNFASFGATESDKVKGVIGGAQAGYNWEVNNFVLGLETDIQASGQKGTDTFNGLIINSSTINDGNNPASGIDTSKLDWFGTTRARLGLAVDHWLVYGTGGFAYGEVNQSGAVQPGNPFALVDNAPIGWNQASTKVGWAAGAGFENAIDRHWSWKLEYLYMDLGTATANVSGGVGTNLGGAANCYGSTAFACNDFRNGASGTATSHFTDSILRVGVNYRFN